MKKIVTLGATTLTALTLLGVAQPLAHANQVNGTPAQSQGKSTSVQQKADTDIINIPDANLKKLLNSKIGTARPATQDITVAEAKACTASIAYTDATNKIQDLTGLEEFVNLTQLGFATQDFSDANKIPDLSGMTKLTALNANDCNLSQEGFEQMMTAGTVSNGWTYFASNHITDVSLIGGRAGWSNYKLGSQTIDKTSQEAADGKVHVAKEILKNTDGTSPTITVQNGGKVDGGNVVWDRLPGSTNKVTYTWTGTNSFSGTVTVPVTWASDEDKAQADVNLLFKDNTRAEINPSVTVQKIEDARAEVEALTASAEKTDMLNQIGEAYGQYFVLDAKAMQAGDPLGDKVKSDSSIKTLHDFVEAATDFSTNAMKTKTSHANAGTYDHARGGWSGAIAGAVSRLSSYVPGTDLSTLGLGTFSTDITNLKTAAATIQGDQQDPVNDKVKVEYQFTAQAPGEPGWYGVVPSAIVLKDATRGTGEVADVSLKNATQVGGAYVDYDGGKTVKVGVKSENNFKLEDGLGNTVDYKLDFDDVTGTHDILKDTKEHELGEMKAGETSIVSHAKLEGTATKTGTYVDHLLYHFSEK